MVSEQLDLTTVGLPANTSRSKGEGIGHQEGTAIQGTSGVNRAVRKGCV